MTKAELRCQVMAYGFAVYEMELFLDTHPDDAKAMKVLENLRNKYDEMMSEYEAAYGPWIQTASQSPADTARWMWIDDPWPWDYCEERGE